MEPREHAGVSIPVRSSPAEEMTPEALTPKITRICLALALALLWCEEQGPGVGEGEMDPSLEPNDLDSGLFRADSGSWAHHTSSLSLCFPVDKMGS